MSDRKYKQRGYQDDGGGDGGRRGDRSRSTGPGPRRDPTLKPGGRGLGKPTATVFRCKVCGTENPSENLTPDASCTSCGADLHTCTHCTYFDTSAINQCRDPEAERVAAKAKGNECGNFKPRQAREFKKETDSPRDAKSAFDALFNF